MATPGVSVSTFVAHLGTQRQGHAERLTFVHIEDSGFVVVAGEGGEQRVASRRQAKFAGSQAAERGIAVHQDGSAIRSGDQRYRLLLPFVGGARPARDRRQHGGSAPGGRSWRPWGGGGDRPRRPPG